MANSTNRRFGVHAPDEGSLGEHTLDELLDAYGAGHEGWDGYVWVVSDVDGDMVITIHRRDDLRPPANGYDGDRFVEATAVAWAVEHRLAGAEHDVAEALR